MRPETEEERKERLTYEKEIEDAAQQRRDRENAMLAECEYGEVKGGKIYRCPECGGLFAGLIAIAPFSNEKTGKTLCEACFNKEHEHTY